MFDPKFVQIPDEPQLSVTGLDATDKKVKASKFYNTRFIQYKQLQCYNIQTSFRERNNWHLPLLQVLISPIVLKHNIYSIYL